VNNENGNENDDRWWTTYPDQVRRQQVYDEQRARDAELARHSETWEAAAQHFHPRPSLYDLDWNTAAQAPASLVAQQRADDAAAVAAQEAAQQAQRNATRPLRWAQYVAAHPHAQRADGTLIARDPDQPQDWFR
jgi:hypothetical protein